MIIPADVFAAAACVGSYLAGVVTFGLIVRGTNRAVGSFETEDRGMLGMQAFKDCPVCDGRGLILPERKHCELCRGIGILPVPN